MEGDTCIISLKTGAVNISIHALRVEGDKQRPCTTSSTRTFLSTPSGWRATAKTAAQTAATNAISIHALRVEGDT